MQIHLWQNCNGLRAEDQGHECVCPTCPSKRGGTERGAVALLIKPATTGTVYVWMADTMAFQACSWAPADTMAFQACSWAWQGSWAGLLLPPFCRPGGCWSLKPQQHQVLVQAFLDPQLNMKISDSISLIPYVKPHLTYGQTTCRWKQKIALPGALLGVGACHSEEQVWHDGSSCRGTGGAAVEAD